MVKTIPVIYRDGVFVPMCAVDEIAEGSLLEIVVYLPGDEEAESEDVTAYSLEQNLALLYQTSGLLKSELPADKVRYIVESDQLAELTSELNADEQRFAIPSAHFFEKYQAGEMGDDADVFEWQILYKMHQRLQQEAESYDG